MQRNQNQINAANAMKKAWQIAKDAAAETGKKASLFFRSALKMAWAEIKNTPEITIAAIELPELEGSEKQIKWAKDIRQNSLVYIRILFKTATELLKIAPTEQYKTDLTEICTALKAVAENQSAKFWIDNRHKNTHDVLNNGLMPKLIKAAHYIKPSDQIRHARAVLKQHGYI
ncbi:hypothetical protein [Conchiformibius steedae]|uniref:hypothetical protein n=1 Tax=Conchiformibius steedae TaxID=153493 RepID=UPI0026EDA2DD|nr:hypothetical protein [Conchiformibius steedae]